MEHKQLNFPLSLQGMEDNGVFSGYASVFDVTDSQKDVIVKGAFARTIAEKGTDVKLLWQHHQHEPIGIITHIKEDARGLFVEGKLLLDIQRASEAWSLLKSHAINGLSIGFKALDYTYDNVSGTRYLTDIELFEISLVTFPANSHAGVMKVKGLPDTVREFEHFLRDAGFSRQEAKGISLNGFMQRDAAEDEYGVLETSLARAIATLST